MEKDKIGFSEALCILLIVVLSHIILTFPKTIIESQGTGSLINIIYLTIIGLIILTLFLKLYKNFKNKDIIDISDFLGGKILKFILGIALIAYLLFIASLLVRNTSESFRTMYLQNTPIPYLIFALLVGASYVNKLGSSATIKAYLIIVPGIFIVLLIMFMASVNNFSTGKLFPIMGYGAKNIFVNGFSNLYMFGGTIFFLFIMPMLKKPEQFEKIAYSATTIYSIAVFVTILTLLLMFPLAISSGSNIPLYMQIREITLGNFIQRTDALFVIIWFITLLSYLSIIMNFVTIIFKKITNIKDSSPISNCFLAILFGISLLYSNIVQVRMFQSVYYKTLFLIVLAITFIILILANLKYKLKSERNLNIE